MLRMIVSDTCTHADRGRRGDPEQVGDGVQGDGLGEFTHHVPRRLRGKNLQPGRDVASGPFLQHGQVLRVQRGHEGRPHGGLVGRVEDLHAQRGLRHRAAQPPGVTGEGLVVPQNAYAVVVAGDQPAFHGVVPHQGACARSAASTGYGSARVASSSGSYRTGQVGVTATVVSFTR